MYNIFFYKDKKGNEPVKEYIISLKKKNSKDSLIKLQKIQDYLNILRENGTRAGMPFVRHLDGELWELRPLREIKKANKLMKDYLERSNENE